MYLPTFLYSLNNFNFIFVCRVSEPACYGAAPAPEIFYPEPAPASDKIEHDYGIFLN